MQTSGTVDKRDHLPMNGPWKSLSLAIELIVLLTVVAYIPAIRGGFVWDDDAYVTNNHTLRSAHGLRQIWLDPDATVQYYPLTFTVFWMEYHLWGLNPLGFHVVNVLLQAVNAILFWRLLSRLRVPGAWWAAVVFALHPVHVMSVAWITELKNVLSGFFYLAALSSYLCFCGWDGGRATRQMHRQWFYGLGMALYLCALLSKTSTSVLPVAVLSILWWKEGRIGRKILLPLLPFFVLGIAFGAFTLWLEKNTKGATGSDFTLPLLNRFLVAGRAFWFGLGKLMWPARLTFIYPRFQIDPTTLWQYVFPLGTIVLFVMLWLARSWIGRAPLAAAVYFYLAFPVLVIFEVIYMMRYTFVSDHWFYLGSMSVIPLGVSGAVMALNRWAPAFRRGGSAGGAVVVAVLGLLTWRQGHIYKDLETLWRDTLAKSPESWMARNNLGVALSAQGRFPEAIEHYQLALRLRPGDAEVYFNWGNALARQGMVAEAIEQYQQALRLRPGYGQVRNNLGNTLVRQGKISEAIEQYQLALQVKPNDSQVHNNLGYALLKAGQVAEAIEQYQQALRIEPDYIEAHSNLGDALVRQGRVSEAVAKYQQVLKASPDWPHALRNLGWILATNRDASLRNGTEAVRCAERLCEITGDQQTDALDVLGAAYAEAGRFDDAAKTARQALDLAKATGQSDVAGRIQERLGLYQAGHPYHEPPLP